MTTRHTDVVVVGDGPAGSALAHGCARRGVDTVLVGAGQPWAATYGCWVDDLEPAGDDLGRVADLFAVTMPDPAVVTDRRQILARSYGVLDNEAVRHRFLEGLDHHRERVERVGAAGGGHQVELGDGSTIRCRLVIDATGWPSGLVPPGRIEVPAWQTAIGVVLPEPPAGDLGTPTLMDFRPVRADEAMRESTIGPAGVATFAYSIPVHDGWLVEETVLAARPTVEPISLLARLAARLGRHPDTLLGDAVRSEYVRIPMGTPIATLARHRQAAHRQAVRWRGGAVRGGRWLHPPGDGLLGRCLVASGSPGGRCDRRRHRRRPSRRLRGGGRSRRGVGRRVADGDAAHAGVPRHGAEHVVAPRCRRPERVLLDVLRPADATDGGSSCASTPRRPTSLR